MKYRIFSMEQAQDALTAVRPLVARIMEKKHSMIRMHDELLTMDLLDEDKTEKNYETEDGKEYMQHATSLENLIVSFENDLKELRQIGCVLRDPEKGTVDFYHEHNGGLVFLTWTSVDETIEYWHDIDSSYAERIALDELI